MRLSRGQIDILSFQIVKLLQQREQIETPDFEGLVEKIKICFEQDLAVEDALDEEVRDLLETHREEMSRSNITYHEMFKMVKKKLVKERNLII